MQTGKLRDAWRNAEWKSKAYGKTFRVVIQPQRAGDFVKGGKGSLTAIMQNKIARAGGNTRLLRGGQVRRVVRDALVLVRDGEFGGLRIRLRGKGR